MIICLGGRTVETRGGGAAATAPPGTQFQTTRTSAFAFAFDTLLVVLSVASALLCEYLSLLLLLLLLGYFVLLYSILCVALHYFVLHVFVVCSAVAVRRLAFNVQVVLIAEFKCFTAAVAQLSGFASALL